MTDMASKEDEGSMPTTILLSSPPSPPLSLSPSFCVRACARVCVCVYSRLIIIVESAVRVKRKELRGRKKKERNLIGKSCPTQEKRNTKKNETKNKNTQNNNFVFF